MRVYGKAAGAVFGAVLAVLSTGCAPSCGAPSADGRCSIAPTFIELYVPPTWPDNDHPAVVLDIITLELALRGVRRVVRAAMVDLTPAAWMSSSYAIKADCGNSDCRYIVLDELGTPFYSMADREPAIFDQRGEALRIEPIMTNGRFRLLLGNRNNEPAPIRYSWDGAKYVQSGEVSHLDWIRGRSF